MFWYFLLFAVIFFTLLFAFNYYILWRLKTLGFPKWLKWLFVFLGISLPFSMWLSRHFYNFFIRAYYTIAFTWLGALFYVFCLLLIYEIVRHFIKLPIKVWRYVILSLSTIIVLGAIINGQMLRVKEVNLDLDNLSQPVKLVQLSDLHIGTVHNSSYLKRIIKKVNEIQPDIVVITGDFFDGSAFLDEHLVDDLSLLEAPSYLSIGNHENYEGFEAVADLMLKTKTVLLENRKIDFQDIDIIAINHPLDEDFSAEPDLSEIEIKNDKPTILLFHQPTGMESSAKAGVDLQLSGHTHAGQLFPFNFVIKLWYPYYKGLYEIDNMKLYVSPGTGTWGPAMRLGSYNEITVFNID